MTLATPATLSSVIESLKTSGGAIQLSADTFPAFSLTGINPAAPLMFDCSLATLTHVGGGGSSNIVFSGGKMDASGQYFGFQLSRISNLTITGMELFGAKQSLMGLSYMDHLAITGCKFHSSLGDGIELSSSNTVTIQGNAFYNFVATGVHPDAVQMWNALASDTSHDILIAGNTCIGLQQGFDNFGGNGGAFHNIKIKNNLISTSAYWGVALFNANNCEVSGNIAWTLPRANGDKAAVFMELSNGTSSHPNSDPTNICTNNTAGLC